MSFFKFFTGQKDKESLDKGLEKTKTGFLTGLGKAILGKSTIDTEVLDTLEEVLIGADVGVETTVKIIDKIEARVARDKYLNANELNTLLKDEIAGLLKEPEDIDTQTIKPYVIMVVGVNGVGKTTTIGKMASQFKAQGLKVVLGAADTFRAAAVDQLKLWGERTGTTVVEHGMNTDPASVAYDAVNEGIKQNADIVIIDTAGRLHNKVNLMNELTKIKKVMQKLNVQAPHDVMLVLDGSTGQNAISQATEFTKATEVTSLAITKLDGTAKGGVVIGISDKFNIPIRFIGVGEKAQDLQKFDKVLFVNSLFEK